MRPKAKFHLQPWLVIPLMLYLLILTACTTASTNTTIVEDDTDASSIADDAWMVPTDAASPTQPDYLELGWQSFIAMNWPAVTGSGAYPGQPDKHLNITNPDAANLPTVWLTWMMPEQVFLPQAANPGTWSAPTLALPMKEDPVTQEMLPVIGGLSKFSAGSNDDEFDEAGSNDPLIDQQSNYVFFDIRMNEAEFTYLSLTAYYNAQNQINAVEANPITFASFPDTGQPDNFKPSTTLNDWAQFGATEVKASWRILVDGKDDPSRYYTMRAFVDLPDGTVGGPYTLGLVGFHILRLTPSTHSTWFWATFEQVDNITAPSSSTASFNDGSTANCQQNGYSYKPDAIEYGKPLPSNPPVNVCRVTPIPADVATLNASYQQQLSGTPWQYYQMVNTLNPMPNGPCAITHNPPGATGATMNACEMVNVSMETYTQPNTQCNSCHQYGAPQGNIRPADIGNLQIFTFLLGHAQMPDSTNFKNIIPPTPMATSSN